MRVQPLHDWNLEPKAAIALQRDLAAQVKTEGTVENPRYIAGVDVSIARGETVLTAGVIVWDMQTNEVIEQQSTRLEAPMPYIPGLLSFREIPALVPVLEALHTTPDVLLVDGQGRAHPRRLGIAAHLGLMIDLPVIGVAKSILCGTHGPLGPEAGSQAPLWDKCVVIGQLLRTKKNVKPVIVSVGNDISLQNAVETVIACTRGYRLPEPTRLAHNYVNAVRRGEL